MWRFEGAHQFHHTFQRAKGKADIIGVEYAAGKSKTEAGSV